MLHEMLILSFTAVTRKTVKRRMVIFSFLCAVMAVANSIGVDSSQLESKAFHGTPASNGEYKYLASLQLNNQHICSAGLFRKGFLLTTAECSWNIGSGMRQEDKNATAVIGNINLQKAQRVRILKAAYSEYFVIDDPSYLNNFRDIGVIMIENDLDYTDLKIVDIHPDLPYLRLHGRRYEVCGWVTDTKTDQEVNHTGESVDSANLRCISTYLHNRGTCTNIIGHGDFIRKLICGQAKKSMKHATLEDVGSPLTAISTINGQKETFIVGITLHPVIFHGVTFFRFIRAYRVEKDIQRMVWDLNPEESNNIFETCGEEGKLDKESKKRRKVGEDGSE